MFPFMMKFFGSFNSAELMFLPSLDAVFSLYTKFLIAMGLIFQMPTIVMFLAKMRMVTARFLLRNVKYAVLIAFIVSAVITPTADPGNADAFRHADDRALYPQHRDRVARRAKGGVGRRGLTGRRRRSALGARRSEGTDD